MRSEFEVDRAVEQYSDMIKRICLYHLKNAADTEDVFQTVFLKYLLYEGSFEGPGLRRRPHLFRQNRQRCWMPYWRCPLNTKTPFIFIIMRAILPGKSAASLAKRKIRSIRFCPEGGRC